MRGLVHETSWIILLLNHFHGGDEPVVRVVGGEDGDRGEGLGQVWGEGWCQPRQRRDRGLEAPPARARGPRVGRRGFVIPPKQLLNILGYSVLKIISNFILNKY